MISRIGCQRPDRCALRTNVFTDTSVLKGIADADRLRLAEFGQVCAAEIEDSPDLLLPPGIEPGAADRSYGIEVARLAGLPPKVIQRARSVLLHHEVREHSVG